MADTDTSDEAPPTEAGDGEADERGKKAAREAFEQLEQKPKSKKVLKKVLLGRVALLVFGGGGGYAYLHFFAPETEEEVVEAVEEVLPPARTVFVHMKRLIVRIEGPDGRQQNLVLQLVLDLKSYDRTRVIEAEPRLREAYLKALFDPPLRRVNGGDAIDVNDIKARLRVASDRVMGAGVVRDVLLHNVSVGYGL